jgi:hypothetical protein
MKYALGLLILVLGLHPQPGWPDYIVYLVTGKATLAQRGTQPVQLKQYQPVFKNSTIIIPRGIQVTLVNKKGDFLVLDRPGSYSFSNPALSIANRTNEGLTQKYLRLLFDELVDPSSDLETFRKKNITAVWGGVDRGPCPCKNRIFPDSGFKTADSLIRFSWHSTSQTSQYLLELINDHAVKVAAFNVTDTTRLVDMRKIGQPGKYYWQVSSKDGGGEDPVISPFFYLTADAENQLIRQLTGDTAIRKFPVELTHIDVLEQHHLTAVAAGRYEQLLKADPDNRSLRKFYISFLINHGFDQQAGALWNHVLYHP